MKYNEEYIGLNAVDKQSKAFFAGGKFQWEKTEADVWATLESQIDAQPQGRSLFLNFGFSKWVVAASILIIFSIGSFLRFYTIKIETLTGQHLLAELPDHSKVNLNAQSTLTYHPFWWKINRMVKLEGEGFCDASDVEPDPTDPLLLLLLRRAPH